jgi:predicted ATPase
MSVTDLYIVTGVPGSGKTTILDHVGARVRCVGEPAREVLAEQRSVDGIGTPDRDASLFLDLLLERSMDNRVAAERCEGSVVFDRRIATYGGARSSRAESSRTEPSSSAEPSGRKNLGLPSAISSPNPWWTNR